MRIKLTAESSSTIKNKTGGWRTYIPRTDYDKCIGCGTCAKVCPESAITMVKDNNQKPKRTQKPVTDFDYCKGCGVCAEECPVKAITMQLDKK
jgi:2-oxoacid:acceptor oxidoreductase delta subunit (pyruvate/2-ketoisovalerate family)